ncbi:MAG: tetratricopeptide repeat protein [Thermodesulfobacteria bacterium]|nr:tetratricopeptide repeat protein [Thermodesulfobacteriota bacterium]
MTFSEVDIPLFEKGLREELKGHFPFEELSLFNVSNDAELDGLVQAIPFSERQRERARSCLREGRPFWDRILHQAIIPIKNGKGSSTLICRITGMPKTIGAEEGQWFLSLAGETMKGWLKEEKQEALFHETDGIPLYLDLLFDHYSQRTNVIEVSFYKEPNLEVRELQQMLGLALGKCQIVFCGLADGSFWFEADSVIAEQMGPLVKRGLRAFKRSGLSLRRFYVYEGVDGKALVARLKSLGLGLKTRALARCFVEELLGEIGIGPVEDFEFPQRLAHRVGKSSIGAFFVFASEENRNRAKETLEAVPFSCDIGKKGLFAIIKGSRLGDDGELSKRCRGVFDTFKGIEEGVIGGFASPSQAHVSKDGLFFSAFLAMYHAHLLGPGNMAIYDHVTCNVHGDILFSWGDLPGAVACYRKGLSLDSNDTNLLNSLGACLADLSRLSEAEAYFLKVLEQDPTNEMALYNLSGIYLKKGRLDEAREAASRALAASGQDIALLKRLLEIHIAQKAWKEAWEVSRKVLENFPDCSGSVLRLCSRAALEAGKWQEAKDILGRLLKKCPSDPEGILLLARGFFEYDKDVATVQRLIKGLEGQHLTKQQERWLRQLMEGLEEAGTQQEV